MILPRVISLVREGAADVVQVFSGDLAGDWAGDWAGVWGTAHVEALERQWLPYPGRANMAGKTSALPFQILPTRTG